MSIKHKPLGVLWGSLALIALVITTTLAFIPILIIGLLKLIPIERWQIQCTRWIDVIVMMWCGFNTFYVNHMPGVQIHTSGLGTLNKKDWYLVIANHQSWLDIVMLQRLFLHKIPALKFFIKDQLKWVPLLGFAWWAMGCPFMKRYSKEYLAKNPHKKGEDLKATQKAIQSFKKNPATIMSFVEGTRFTPEKKAEQKSPYQYLLKPKAGGVSFVISAMGKELNHLLDVTICYAEEQHSLWDFLCGRVQRIDINVRELIIPAQFRSDALSYDEGLQTKFRDWLNTQWEEKDRLLAAMKMQQNKN